MGPSEANKPDSGNEQRKKRVLSHGESSTTRGISDALVVKNGDFYFLTNPDGEIPPDSGHALGLYFHDTRYLRRYELRLCGTRPDMLHSGAEAGVEAVLEATNRDLHLPSGGTLKKESLGVRSRRTLIQEHRALLDRIDLRNFSSEPIELSIDLTVDCAFEDIFSIRGMLADPFGRESPSPVQQGGCVIYARTGHDNLYRRTTIRFSPEPTSIREGTAHFGIAIGTAQTATIQVAITVTEAQNHNAAPDLPVMERIGRAAATVKSSPEPGATRVVSDDENTNRILKRSLRDVKLLESRNGDLTYTAAGVPWFVALFGRDSVIAALQVLMFTPDLAEKTLITLAHFQGIKEDSWREEEPGKILHELRLDELTHAGKLPYSPYYGTVDATALFLILLARHAAWTGSTDLFNRLRRNVDAALDWIDRFGDSDGDGYIDYTSATGHGLINKGWKDSGDAVVNADGSLAIPPIALVEVQGYVYMAKRAIAECYRRTGEPDTAARLEKEASDLQSRFNRDYWLDSIGFFAMALQKDGRPAAVVSSNPGQALWTGIVDPQKARQVVERLMREDMFSGWGIRTLSTRERRYNPLSYHLGSVWPHDNALAAGGFRRYGFDAEARTIFNSILHAAAEFKHFRLPELFTGIPAGEIDEPVRYPVACHPQAWGAGSIPFLLEALLGLQPHGFDRHLKVVRPMLPKNVSTLRVENLRMGGESVDLLFRRSGDRVQLEVTGNAGGIDVNVE